MKSKFWSIVLRGGGISGKFLLVFLLTKKISLEFQGAYTLLNTTVVLLIFLLGLDFHSYSNKIIIRHLYKTMFIFKNSLVFYISLYVFLIPALYFMLLKGMLQQEMLVIFFFLVITEHLSLELFRIFIAIEKVLLANILFFLRTGAWSFPFTIYEGYGGTSPVAYSAIKGGIINFTRYLASYYGKDNVRVNCVSPGGIEDNQHPSFIERYEYKSPLKRMGKPHEIAPAITFLLSDEASFITGHNLMVDGGWTAI